MKIELEYEHRFAELEYKLISIAYDLLNNADEYTNREIADRVMKVHGNIKELQEAKKQDAIMDELELARQRKNHHSA